MYKLHPLSLELAIQGCLATVAILADPSIFGLPNYGELVGGDLFIPTVLNVAKVTGL